MTSVTGDLPEHLACYVYGVVRPSLGLPGGLTGIDEAPVELIEHEDLAVAVGVVAWERPGGRRADLIAHSEVLDALAAAGPVVPVQFGTVLPDRRTVVEEVLISQEDRLRDLLSQLDRRAQFNLRGVYDEAAVLAEVVAEDPEVAALRERTRDQPGEASYAERVRLGALVAEAVEAKREVDGQVVLDAVLPHCAAYRLRPVSGLERVFDVALLVDEDKRGVFEDTLEAVAEGVHERMRLRLLGPLAPYDFVED